MKNDTDVKKQTDIANQQAAAQVTPATDVPPEIKDAHDKFRKIKKILHGKEPAWFLPVLDGKIPK